MNSRLETQKLFYQSSWSWLRIFKLKCESFISNLPSSSSSSFKGQVVFIKFKFNSSSFHQKWVKFSNECG